jgi:serine/threonine protein kinase
MESNKRPKIDRFEIVKALGKGSQGVVYLAHDPNLERVVAIKTLSIDPKTDPRAHQLLSQEARIVARLQHPSIVPIYEVGEFRGRPYLVFEYIDGTTLASAIAAQVKRSGKGFSVEQSIKWILPVLEGIGYAHEEGVIHGDLTPANILISRKGVPRVMDFGIARVIGKSSERREGLWGSIHYMSPEHFGRSEPDARSDLFSIGLILWEMLTGKRAIEADNQLVAMHKIANEPVPRPSAAAKGIDPALDGVIQRALEKEPGQRFATAEEMRQAVAQCQKKDELDPASAHKGDGSQQSTLGFLLIRMKQRPDFPAISQNIGEVSRAASTEGDTSANELSNLVLKDYSLTNKLLKLVNSSFYSQYGGKISTVSRAVVILGFEQVRMATISLMLFEHLKDSEQANELKDTVLGSLVSGSVSRNMAQRIGIRDREQAFICSMLHNLGKMLTIFYFPDEYSQIKHLVDQRKIEEEQASRSVLKISYSELGRGVAREWNFPENLVDSMGHFDAQEEISKPRTESEKLQLLANFSSELTQLAGSGDLAHKQRGLDHLSDRFKGSIGLRSEQIDKLIDNALDSVDQFAEILSINTKKSRMMRRIQGWTAPPEGESTVTVTTLTGEGGLYDEQKDDGDDRNDPMALQMALLNGVQEITNALLGEYSVNELMMMILETMYRGLGLNRVLVCIADQRRTTMHARFGFGQEVDRLIPLFKFQVAIGSDLFGSSMAERKDLIIEDVANVDNLPGWYQEHISSSALALYPIVINQVAIGLFYADLADGQRFTTTHLNYMKTLRNQAVLAIRQKA